MNFFNQVIFEFLIILVLLHLDSFLTTLLHKFHLLSLHTSPFAVFEVFNLKETSRWICFLFAFARGCFAYLSVFPVLLYRLDLRMFLLNSRKLSFVYYILTISFSRVIYTTEVLGLFQIY